MNKNQKILLVIWVGLTAIVGINTAHYLCSDNASDYWISLQDKDSSSRTEELVILWTASSLVVGAVFPFCGTRKIG